MKRTDWPRGDIDRFLLAALEARGLAPVADADRSRLLRRVTFDLIGLPPTPEEIDAFLADDSPDAFAKRRRSAARLAPLRRALGAALARRGPVRRVERQDEFRLSPGLALSRLGDRLIQRRQALRPIRPRADRRRPPARRRTTASGPSSSSRPASSPSAARPTTPRTAGSSCWTWSTSRSRRPRAAFLGLTVACARCHDHKMDPISQRDYYALSGIFRSTQTCSGTLPGVFPNFNASPLIELPTGASVAAAVPPLPPGQRAAMEERLAGLGPRTRRDPPGRGESGPAAADELAARDAPLSPGHRPRPTARPARSRWGSASATRPSTARSTSAASSTSPARSSLAGSSGCSATRRRHRSRRGAAAASWRTGSPRPRIR